MVISGKALSLPDRILLLFGIPMSIFVLWFLIPLYFRDSGDYALKSLFFIPLFLLFGAMIIVGFLCQFATISLSDEAISYSYFWFKKSIPWVDVIEWDFPIIIFRGGFTPYVFIKRKNGKKTFIPCGPKAIRETLIRLQIDQMILKYKEANQPDPTRMDA